MFSTRIRTSADRRDFLLLWLSQPDWRPVQGVPRLSPIEMLEIGTSSPRDPMRDKASEPGSQRCSCLPIPINATGHKTGFIVEINLANVADCLIFIMHRHAEPHAIAPLLHRPLTYHPMGHQNRNFDLHPDRQRQRPYFGPASAFHNATPKSSRSATRRSSSALHVCIAWRIYYHKQLKKIQQKSNSLPQETLLQLPIISPPDSEQLKEPLPSCRHPHLDSSLKNSSGTSETKEKEADISHDRSDLPEMLPYKPAFHLSSETQQDDGEKMGRPVKLLLDENLDPERHKNQQTNTTLSPPFRDKPWDPKVIVEPGGQQRSSLDRKRLLEGCSLDDVKRLRQIAEDEPFDSSSVTTPRVNPSVQIQVQNMSVSGLCVSCCNGCSPTVSHPGIAPHPYQSASWEQTWNHRMDAHLRHKIFKEYFCDRFQRFLASQRYSPLAPRHQDTVHLRDVFIPG